MSYHVLANSHLSSFCVFQADAAFIRGDGRRDPTTGNRSPVWKHFSFRVTALGVIDKTCVICGHCDRALVYGSSTSHMRLHLKKQHGIVVESTRASVGGGGARVAVSATGGHNVEEEGDSCLGWYFFCCCLFCIQRENVKTERNRKMSEIVLVHDKVYPYLLLPTFMQIIYF